MGKRGFITDTATVDVGSDVRETARVEDHAVLKLSTLLGYAVVSGSVQLRSSVIRDEAEVSGKANVSFSTISDEAVVGEGAVCVRCDVSGHAEIRGNAKVGKVHVGGYSHIFGEANLQNDSFFKVTLKGSCKFGGNATFVDLVTDEDFINKYGADKAYFYSNVTENGVVLTDVWDMG